jgi:hypothetical protein
MRFTIISALMFGYGFGLLVALSSVNVELKYIVDNREPRGWSTIEVKPTRDPRTVEVVSSADYGNSVEVKPARRYEDCVQCAAGGRNVQNSGWGYEFQVASYGYFGY